MINKNEKRKRKLRIAARKRKERLEYREKDRNRHQENDEWSNYNLKLQSDKKKAKIWCLITLLLTFGLSFFFFFILYKRSEQLGATLVLLIYILCSVLVSILPWMYARFESRCHHAIQLAECPIYPLGVLPELIGIRYRDNDKNDFFEDVKDDIFTCCSAKKIVIMTDPGNLGHIIFMLLTIFALYIMGDIIYNDWKSGEALTAFIIILGLLSTTVFFYLYTKKNTFIIDRENKMITIPPIYRFGKEKILPYDQVVVSFCSGTAPGCTSRGGVLVDDYISLTGKDDLPFGPNVGFRGDISTKYRFARFICEYMNVADLEDMPEIEGFEDIISKIKQDNALRNKSSYGFPT